MIHQNFEMKNFSAEKERDVYSDWKSPAMYTHVGGYRFRIGVDANGFGSGRGTSIHVDLWVLPGEFDEYLNWPAKAKFTIELINQQGGQNESSICQVKWDKPICLCYLESFNNPVAHVRLGNFLNNDSLFFNVSDVEVL